MSRYFRREEREVIPKEPGVIRKVDGRIVGTGWPDISPEQWPIAYNDIQEKLDEVIHMEVLLSERNVSPRGVVQLGPVSFNLAARDVDTAMEELLDSLLTRETDIRVLDCGAGEGHYANTVNAFRRGEHWSHQKNRGNIHLIATTLTELGAWSIRKYLSEGKIDEHRLMAMELPDGDLYNSLDLIIAQNSIFYWSYFPELVLTNALKMLKVEGCMLFTFPIDPKNLPVKIVNVEHMIQTFVKKSRGAFCFQVIERRNNSVIGKIMRMY